MDVIFDHFCGLGYQSWGSVVWNRYIFRNVISYNYLKSVSHLGHAVVVTILFLLYVMFTLSMAESSILYYVQVKMCQIWSHTLLYVNRSIFFILHFKWLNWSSFIYFYFRCSTYWILCLDTKCISHCEYIMILYYCRAYLLQLVLVVFFKMCIFIHD